MLERSCNSDTLHACLVTAGGEESSVVTQFDLVRTRIMPICRLVHGKVVSVDVEDAIEGLIGQIQANKNVQLSASMVSNSIAKHQEKLLSAQTKVNAALEEIISVAPTLDSTDGDSSARNSSLGLLLSEMRKQLSGLQSSASKARAESVAEYECINASSSSTFSRSPFPRMQAYDQENVVAMTAWDAVALFCHVYAVWILQRGNTLVFPSLVPVALDVLFSLWSTGGETREGGGYVVLLRLLSAIANGSSLMRRLTSRFCSFWARRERVARLRHDPQGDTSHPTLVG
jgi:hypothetical protein